MLIRIQLVDCIYLFSLIVRDRWHKVKHI